MINDRVNLADRISAWIKERVEEANCNGAVFGLSGGVDSALVAALCKKAFPKNSLGIIMPCYSNPDDEKDAHLVAEHLGIEVKKVDLSPVFESFMKQVGQEDFTSKNRSMEVINVKPRLRMTTLYYYANKLNYLVVGTGNKSEFYMGYFTKYGDGGVDIMPIADLTKTEVWQLSAEVGVPEQIIKRTTSAGLFEGQTDEGEMGITYAELDRTIGCIEAGNEAGCNPEILAKLKRIMRLSEHKKKSPPIFRK